jgi:hypothetical protein
MVKMNLSSPKTLGIGLNPLILIEKRLFAKSPVVPINRKKCTLNQ